MTASMFEIFNEFSEQQLRESGIIDVIKKSFEQVDLDNDGLDFDEFFEFINE